MSITPASYFNYDSTPFMQGLTSSNYSFEGQNQDNYGGFGLNRYKKGGSDSNNLFSVNNRATSNPNRSLFASNRGAPTADVLGYEPTKSDVMPRNFKIQDAHDAIDAAVPALMPGDGGVGDATAIKQVNDVKENLTQIANSPNPDAMAQSLMSQPGYGSNSFGGGLMMMGLSIMSGADPLEAAKAGLQGQDYFDEKDRKAHTSDYLRQNARQLLDAGYSPDSISAAITNGDNSLLKMRQLSPEEKRRQDLEDQEAQNQEWRNRNDISQKNAIELKGIESADAQARISAQNARQDAKEKAAQEAEDKANNYVFSTMPKSKGGSNPQITKLAGRYEKDVNNYYMANQVSQSLDGLEDADPRDQLATMQAEGDRLARSLLGGNATLTPEQIKEITGSPMTMDQFADWLTTNTDQGRATRAIKYMKKVADASRHGYEITLRDKVSADRESFKRYNNGDPHKTVQDIITVTGLSPEMFMRPDEAEEYNKTGRWVKTGGVKKHGVSANGAPLSSANTSGKPAKQYSDAASQAAMQYSK